MQNLHSSPEATLPSSNHPARGFAATFGLHPAIAALALAVDGMLFSTELVGVGLLLSVPVSAAVGLLTYRAQQKWFADDADSAAIKAGILSLLVAIPTAFPSWLYLPAGFIGLFRRKH